YYRHHHDLPSFPTRRSSDLRNDAMAAAISPLAPARFPDMPPVAGVKLATAAAGIRYGGRTDVLLALFEQGTSVAGVFTRSKCPRSEERRVGKGCRSWGALEL